MKHRNKEDEYEILDYYMSKTFSAYTIRVYSDSTVCVAGYIVNDKIHLEGSYDLVLTCIKQLHWELGI